VPWADWADWADWTWLDWKWAYWSWVTYSVDDWVSYQGNSYIAIQGSVGATPDSSPTYWSVMASKWLDWTNGTNWTNGTDWADWVIDSDDLSVLNIVWKTQAEYDALTPVATTLYLITT
jgi:hypothetical protein